MQFPASCLLAVALIRAYSWGCAQFTVSVRYMCDMLWNNGEQDGRGPTILADRNTYFLVGIEYTCAYTGIPIGRYNIRKMYENTSVKFPKLTLLAYFE